MNMDINQLSKMLGEWFEIVKKRLPEEKKSNRWYDTVYDDMDEFCRKYHEASEADRWLVVELAGAFINYEVKRLEGVKDKTELDFKAYLRKRLKDEL